MRLYSCIYHSGSYRHQQSMNLCNEWEHTCRVSLVLIYWENLYPVEECTYPSILTQLENIYRFSFRVIRFSAKDIDNYSLFIFLIRRSTASTITVCGIEAMQGSVSVNFSVTSLNIELWKFPHCNYLLWMYISFLQC